MSRNRMSNKEVWITTEDGKGKIPANRAARRAYQRLKGVGLPRPIKQPTVKHVPEQE